jgi:hypothetical protein
MAWILSHPEGCCGSLLHRWDFSHFSSEPSNMEHFLHAPHMMHLERINVRSSSATILRVKLDDELEASDDIGREFEAGMPQIPSVTTHGRKSVTRVTRYSRYFLLENDG